MCGTDINTYRFVQLEERREREERGKRGEIQSVGLHCTDSKLPDPAHPSLGVIVMDTPAVRSVLREEDCVRLSAVYSEWVERLRGGEMTPHDFVGSFVLAWVATVHGSRKCFAGPIRPCLYTDRETLHALATASQRIVDIPHLRDILQAEALRAAVRWCGVRDCDALTVCMVLNHVRLHGIQQNKRDCVNVSIVQWALARRPFVVLFHIPLPMEVLEMQARGRRVVSVLYRAEELRTVHTSRLLYMSDEPYHHKDSNEFLCHDLRHMEHFAGDPLFYPEQVGLFSSLFFDVDPAQHDLPAFFAFYSHSDPVLWHQLEYALSDMNSVSRHILQYIKAKWKTQDQQLAHLERNGVLFLFFFFFLSLLSSSSLSSAL
jgi:hypothetical protein